MQTKVYVVDVEDDDGPIDDEPALAIGDAVIVMAKGYSLLQRRVDELQERGTALLLENRDLKARVAELENRPAFGGLWPGEFVIAT